MPTRVGQACGLGRIRCQYLTLHDPFMGVPPSQATSRRRTRTSRYVGHSSSLLHAVSPRTLTHPTPLVLCPGPDVVQPGFTPSLNGSKYFERGQAVLLAPVFDREGSLQTPSPSCPRSFGPYASAHAKL